MSAPRCPRCTASLVEIRIQLDDRPVTMRSCNRCDLRWWDRDGDVVELATVLELASVRR